MTLDVRGRGQTLMVNQMPIMDPRHKVVLYIRAGLNGGSRGTEITGQKLAKQKGGTCTAQRGLIPGGARGGHTVLAGSAKPQAATLRHRRGAGESAYALFLIGRRSRLLTMATMTLDSHSCGAGNNSLLI